MPYGRASAIRMPSCRLLALTAYTRSLVLRMTVTRLTLRWSSRSSISRAGPARSDTSWMLTTSSAGMLSNHAGLATNFCARARAYHTETLRLRNATSTKRSNGNPEGTESAIGRA
jgi:hypothetical protein